MGQLEEIRTFVRIAELESIGKAAEREGVAKSGMSRRLRLLEERLGIALITRTTRQWALTTEGDAYLVKASRILSEIEEAAAEIADRGIEIKGDIRLSIPLHYGTTVLTPLLLKFGRQHPRVHLYIDYDDRLADLVGEHHDFAIRISDLADSSMNARKLSETRHVFCASPGYLRDAPEIRCPDDLKRHRILQIGHARRFNWSFGTTASGRSQVALVSTFSSNNGNALIQAALSGFGISRLPDFIAADALADGGLVRVLDGWEPPALPINIVYPATRHLPYRLRALIDFLVAECHAAQGRD